RDSDLFGSCSARATAPRPPAKLPWPNLTEKRSTDWKGYVTDRDLLHTYNNDVTKTILTVAELATMFVANITWIAGPQMLPMKSASRPMKPTRPPIRPPSRAASTA
ncbi:MAG: hypothetical protein MZV49_06390, partial [Rhodopseudomonas palustris]|nr:hypothetical protein [Rhodopseudomonas palustris]